MSRPLPGTGDAPIAAADTDRGLREQEVDPDPFRQFAVWLSEAIRDAAAREPVAMTLATADARGRPSARMVLLRGVNERGFTFYTNYESQKGRELAENPYAALCFYWDALGRQVRAVGRVERLQLEESQAYFASRPPGSRVAAWASPQSRVIADRGELEARFAAMGRRHAEAAPPLPPFWGGYRLIPAEMEFWVGRPDRLHDRLRYRRGGPGEGWRIERLAQ
ncbi:pyridoxamine 5'-phosphate oxidase [soil metagenome]